MYLQIPTNVACKYYHCCGRLEYLHTVNWSVLLLLINIKYEWLIISLFRINIILIRPFKLINAHSVIDVNSCISLSRMRETYPDYRPEKEMEINGMLFLWFLLVTFESVHSLTSTAYHQCLDLGSLNPSDVSTLNTIGLQQCMRECLGDRSCSSLNYWRNDLKCTQHRVKTGGPYGLVPDSDCIYIERQDLPMVSIYSSCQGFLFNALN